MNGNLRREIFYRNNLKNRYIRNRTNINWHKYKKQRNKVVGLRRSAIRAYFDKKCKSDSQSKHFWDTVKPLMTDKVYSAGNIMLQEDDCIVTDKSHVSEILNEYYCTIADDIGQSDNIDGASLLDIFDRHNEHPSIQEIKYRCTDNTSFTFSPLSEASVCHEMKSLQANKATGFDNIPPRIVKLCSHVLSPSFTKLLNNCISQCCFPADMKKQKLFLYLKRKM